MRTGGCPAGLIGQLLAETRIEALPAAPDGGLEGIEEWVTDQAQQMAGQLLSGGQVSVATSRGTLRASLELPGWLKSGILLVHKGGDNGVTGSGSTRLTQHSERELQDEISQLLARDIIDLVGG